MQEYGHGAACHLENVTLLSVTEHESSPQAHGKIGRLAWTGVQTPVTSLPGRIPSLSPHNSIRDLKNMGSLPKVTVQVAEPRPNPRTCDAQRGLSCSRTEHLGFGVYLEACFLGQVPGQDIRESLTLLHPRPINMNYRHGEIKCFRKRVSKPRYPPDVPQPSPRGTPTCSKLMVHEA